MIRYLFLLLLVGCGVDPVRQYGCLDGCPGEAPEEEPTVRSGEQPGQPRRQTGPGLYIMFTSPHCHDKEVTYYLTPAPGAPGTYTGVGDGGCRLRIVVRE